MTHVTITGNILKISSIFTAFIKLVTIRLGRKTLSIKPESYFRKSELKLFNRYINAPTMQITKTERHAESTDSIIA